MSENTPKYTPLHVHSHYSLLDGLTKIPDLVAKAKEDGMPAVALTDHGTMYGAIEFYQACKKAGVKPIVGVEAYVVDNLRVKSADTEERFHLVLLAKDLAGYKNLIKLTSIAHLEGFYYKPRVDYATLRAHSEGVIALSACLQGEVPKAILRGSDEEKIIEVVRKYQDIFGADNFYLEVQHHPNLPKQKIVNDRIFELGKKLSIDIVATNDSHYLNTEDADAHDILICLQTKKVISDKDRMSYLGEDFSLFKSAQMYDFFRANPEVLENTNKIAERINLEIKLGEIQLPHFELPPGVDDNEYLKRMCLDNVEIRYGFKPDKEAFTEHEKVVMDRLDYELGIIQKTGYASYFLIVQDFIVWSKNNGVVVGPGRGSAAGSLVAYLTQITNLDPIGYDLLFERFLNPERISMPDIDTDFADEKRADVMRYVEGKYGKDHVAGIITFGTLAARAAVKDVGRVLEMPYSFCDKLAKLIPMNMKLKEVIEKIAEVKEMYEREPEAKRLIDYARKLEGVARHASQHACGVVITKNPLNEYCPVQYSRDAEDQIISQYSLHPVEDLGLLKMDFLGLKNLTIIARACDIIEAIHGEKIDIEEIPREDDKTFQLFRDGATTGVFQFESAGMKRYLKQLQPTNIEDLIAMNSLYRPGPMDLIPDYIERKHGRQEVKYLHPKLADSLAKTFGIAVYQEQIMQMARDLAGFSLGEADVLRKAVGKKKADLLAEQKKKFIIGCGVHNGISEQHAEEIFAFIEPFAGYGFNRSHAACYAWVAYQTAYLKANYSAEFMAALMTSDQNDLERISIEIDECKQMGMEVMAPDVNESFSTFSVVADSLKSGKPKIRFGMSAIRNVGDTAAKAVLTERKANGQYKNLEDFLERVGSHYLNKKSLEGLIKSGGLDSFGPRSVLLQNIEKMNLFIKETEQSKATNQVSLFSMSPSQNMGKMKLILGNEETITDTQLLSYEREFLGLYVSAHPYKDFRQKLNDYITPLSAFKSKSFEKDAVRVAGVVAAAKKIMTKAGEPMMFVTIEDGINALEILVFPRTYKETYTYFTPGAVVVAEGTISDKDDDKKVLANKVWLVTPETFDDVLRKLGETKMRVPFFKKGSFDSTPNPQKPKSKLIIEYPVGASKDLARQVKMVFMGLSGPCQVFLRIDGKLIRTDFMIKNDAESTQKIESVLGRGVVKLAG